ncbi:hypothetical protein [Crateriforma spongiae]|uniref:hypothetical protein n=1 Tax=Crateriforma spongiae TaxID=2724528 RepID=UPI0039AFD727
MKRFRLLAALSAVMIVAFFAWNDADVTQPATAQEPSTNRAAKPSLAFERLRVHEDGRLGSHTVRRAKVPGGWLVSIDTGNRPEPSVGITFVPDVDHVWDGNSLP